MAMKMWELFFLVIALS